MRFRDSKGWNIGDRNIERSGGSTTVRETHNRRRLKAPGAALCRPYHFSHFVDESAQPTANPRPASPVERVREILAAPSSAAAAQA